MDKLSKVTFDPESLDWRKGDGLIPAIVQDADDGSVLMLGYMSSESLKVTMQKGKVTFHSRSRDTLWTKGETSGNELAFVSMTTDCDADTLLVRARPGGPVCHLGRANCFDTAATTGRYIEMLERTIRQRSDADPTQSYTAELLHADPLRIAQKIGEEGVEVALAATQDDDDALIDECADLIYHLLVLLRTKNLGFEDVITRLESRSAARRQQ